MAMIIMMMLIMIIAGAKKQGTEGESG